MTDLQWELPFTEQDGKKFLTGRQLIEDPGLAAFVEAHKDWFRLDYDSDIYIWEPPKND